MACIRSNIVVRLLTYDDLSAYIMAFSQDVQEVLHASGYWYEYDYVYGQLQKQACFYGIFTQLGLLIGAIEIRGPEYRGQLYTWINQAWWGKGVFQEAFMEVCKLYFIANPHETTITATVDVSNLRSYRALLKVGFIDKGRCSGPYEDQFVMEFIYSLIIPA